MLINGANEYEHCSVEQFHRGLIMVSISVVLPSRRCVKNIFFQHCVFDIENRSSADIFLDIVLPSRSRVKNRLLYRSAAVWLSSTMNLSASHLKSPYMTRAGHIYRYTNKTLFE